MVVLKFVIKKRNQEPVKDVHVVGYGSTRRLVAVLKRIRSKVVV
jgi:hypothetical protein